LRLSGVTIILVSHERGDTMNILGDIARSQDEWSTIVRFLPDGWRLKAKELGALKRMRNFSDIDALLRTLLIHLLDGCSLRETAVRARIGGLAQISDVALLKRLNSSGEWFRWMSEGLMRNWIEKQPLDVYPGGFVIKVIDATHVSEPGSTGSDWRVHYSINLPSLRCEELEVTDSHIGESFKNFSVLPASIFIGDRGYYNRPGIEYITLRGGQVIVRMNLSNTPLFDSDGNRVDVLKKLRTLKGSTIGDWPVYIYGKQSTIKARVCAIKKNEIAADLAVKKTLKNNSKKQKKVKPETLEAARYIFVLTTLPKTIMKPEIVLEMYRGRWQIELVFKRLKSIVGLSHLPKQDPVGAKAWIQGKIFSAFLIETLISAGERFFPWGYPIIEKEIKQIKVLMA